MRIAIIGRTEILYDTALLLKQVGHEVSCILTAKEAPEYMRTAENFRRLAGHWNVPFAQGPRILEHSDFLQASRSDIAVSINYTGVVPQDVIDLFPLGVLNAHGGDLPRYRGNACQAWAIINGEDRICRWRISYPWRIVWKIVFPLWIMIWSTLQCNALSSSS
jgi:UDP-4-amino-4-deoxy-L-arabinose formyltransferase/UDP-glucuronic acid dehydrogenase (UDP-4-keto-hexauronic acid decarboxylating)